MRLLYQHSHTIALALSEIEQIYGCLMRKVGSGELFRCRTKWRARSLEVVNYGYSS
jgi:hypothetical protein